MKKNKCEKIILDDGSACYRCGAGPVITSDCVFSPGIRCSYRTDNHGCDHDKAQKEIDNDGNNGKEI
jgi:hypothetical protein